MKGVRVLSGGIQFWSMKGLHVLFGGIQFWSMKDLHVLSGGIQFGVFVFYPVVYSTGCSCFIRWYTVRGVHV